jgi:hypothetical protein
VFTYLLRGIDILTIVFVLIYTFLASLILSVVGLLVATITQSRHWQVFLSVILLAALLAAGIFWSSFIVMFLQDTPPYDVKEFWLANLGILCGYVTYLVLFLFAAAGQISFASDNRATPLRSVMMVQQVLWVGWMMYFWVEEHEEELLVVMVTLAAIHWMIMGSLMIGEAAQLSPRVKRSLPQSFLGRMTLTWFNPGSGTGYMFATTNFMTIVLIMVVCGWIAGFAGFRGAPDGRMYFFSFLLWSYLALYLGTGRLLFLFLRKYFYAGIAVTFLLEILLIAAGVAFPFFLASALEGFDWPNYSVLQAPNWMWTFYEVIDNRGTTALLSQLVVHASAIFVFFINVIFAAREVEQVRQETPQRVVEDELELHPEKAEKPAEPRSPWDDDE